MKVVKPIKLAALSRVIEIRRRAELHVTAMLGFPLHAPRTLIDEVRVWPLVMAQLGEDGLVDEGLAKARGELLVAGAFHAPGGVALAASYVRVQVGAVAKRLSVVGDRVWQDGVPSEPHPIATLPIDWPHAFGGRDYDRNPRGKGASPVERDGRLVHPLPNVEPYGALLRSPKDRPEPQSFLPLGLHLPQRRALGGTYDQRWLDEEFPGIASDHDPSFFNLALPDQWSSGFFQGDEPFVVEHMHPTKSRLEGRLPGLLARAFVDQRTSRGRRFREVAMRCDTVWLFPSVELGLVLFHGKTPVQDDDAADVANLVLACEDPASPRDASHYEETLRRRLLDPRDPAFDASDHALMPPMESGVVAELTDTDIQLWVKNDELLAKNMHRGALRQFEEQRSRLLAQGLDPADHGLDTPPPPPFGKAGAGEREAAQEEAVDAEKLQEELRAQKRELEARARAEYAAEGRDFDAEMELATREGAGPPRFKAASHLAELRATVTDAQARGVAMPELEAQLADPNFALRLHEQEQQSRELYLRTAHLRVGPLPLDPETADTARVLVRAAIDTGESLAERDLTGTRLAGMDLRGIDLARAWLEGADLSDANLSGANLSGAVLTRADLRGANLSGANLSGANLGGAKVTGARLDDADARECILTSTALGGVSMVRAKLDGADFTGTIFGDSDLRGASFASTMLHDADLTGTRLAGADLTNATFVRCTLDDADLSGATVTKTTFFSSTGRRLSLRGARGDKMVIAQASAFPDLDLSDAELPNLCCRATDLRGARLERALLTDSDLSECDLAGASLERARLSRSLLIRTKLDGARLLGADLREASLSKALVGGADFQGANLFQADLSRTRGDARTRFVDAEVEKVRTLPKARPVEELEP